MNSRQTAVKSILAERMLPLFFYPDKKVSMEVTRALYKAGVRVLEYTNRGTEALENFKTLRKLVTDEMPDMRLGAGTVKAATEAEAYISAGADFLVSPIMNAEVGKLAHEADLLWIPGCMTPTEIDAAQQHKASIIKIFPANILGPAFISSIRELFPGQLFIPTGGVELEQENINTWFKAGVCAVGMGSKLITKTILENQLYDELYQSTQKAIRMVQSVR